jgi:hypothetical protein
MGIPQNYSQEISHRCCFLLEKLLPITKAGLPGDGQFGGALGTTLLLALATPMIVLPSERILKAIDKRVMADDRQWDAKLADKVADAFQPGRVLDHAPFANAGRWRYLAGVPRFDVGGAWPAAVLHGLANKNAEDAARNVSTKQFVSDLRNALAHGGVTYLDENGDHVYGGAAKQLAFAATDRPNGPRFNILRVAEDDFSDFLVKWSAWLLG